MTTPFHSSQPTNPQINLAVSVTGDRIPNSCCATLLPSFAVGGNVIGDGLGGALFASTRRPLGLSDRGPSPNSLSTGEASAPSKTPRSNESDFSSEGNSGLGRRGAVDEIGDEVAGLVQLGGGARGERGAGMAERRGDDRSNGSRVKVSTATYGLSGLLPRGRPFITGKPASTGGRPYGLAGGLADDRPGGAGAASVRM